MRSLCNRFELESPPINRRVEKSEPPKSVETSENRSIQGLFRDEDLDEERQDKSHPYKMFQSSRSARYSLHRLASTVIFWFGPVTLSKKKSRMEPLQSFDGCTLSEMVAHYKELVAHYNEMVAFLSVGPKKIAVPCSLCGEIGHAMIICPHLPSFRRTEVGRRVGPSKLAPSKTLLGMSWCPQKMAPLSSEDWRDVLNGLFYTQALLLAVTCVTP